MSIVSLSTDAAPDAAVLAKPVLDANGQLLVAAGSPLTHDLKASLLRRGVHTVSIVDAHHAPHATDESDAPIRSRPSASSGQVEARMRHLFRHALRTGQPNPLFDMVSRYRTKDQA